MIFTIGLNIHVQHVIQHLSCKFLRLIGIIALCSKGNIILCRLGFYRLTGFIFCLRDCLILFGNDFVDGNSGTELIQVMIIIV